MSYKTYLVGGAVRDLLLGRKPKDKDYVIVGATDVDVQDLINQGFSQVGADFPVFLHPDTGDEYALARVERKTGVGYHGFNVKADSSVTIEDDLARRDLTINSMAMLDGQIVDPYNGAQDLQNKILRHTTDAFAEDPLRVLRLARFAARFHDWSVAEETIQLCKKICKSGELNHLSIERVWVEIEKAFTEPGVYRFLEVLQSCGALVHCELLKKLFGPLSKMDVKHAKQLALVPVDKRFYVGVGLLAKQSVSALKGPTRAEDCYTNIKALGQVTSGEELLKIMKQARAHQHGVQFDDMIFANYIISLSRNARKFVPSINTLLNAQHAVCSVKASDFPGLVGKDLGAAIDTARIDKLNVLV
jgi:tRNA nucleotidyltransferase/poly(A) polymerase